MVQDHNICLDHLLDLLKWKLNGRYADVVQSCNAADMRQKILQATTLVGTVIRLATMSVAGIKSW